MICIAVLGWGSLVWNPGSLRLAGEWFKDGPCLPVEFARVSKDERLTLVLFPDAVRVPVLWAYLDADDLEASIVNLKEREETSSSRIGFIKITRIRSRCNVVPDIVSGIRQWAIQKSIDSVVWTDLPSNFKVITRMEFTDDNVIKYLKNLNPNAKKESGGIYSKSTLPNKNKDA